MAAKSLDARLRAVEERLRSIEVRLGRAERLGYSSFSDVRTVARYAYENVLLGESPETIRKLPRMEQLQDHEALDAGMSADELVVLKMSLRNVDAQCRQDAVEVAQIIAELLEDAVRASKKTRKAA